MEQNGVRHWAAGSLLLASIVWAASCGGAGDTGAFGTTSGGAGACAGGCPGSLLCDGQLGCVTCLADGDCGSASPFCIAGSCEQCETSGDCQAGASCYPGDHECKPSCSSSADCTSGDATLCDTATGACVECVAGTDCADGELCDPTFGQCSECLTDGDCGVTQPHCDRADGECRECLGDGHCAAGQVCSDGHCVSASCASDADCGGERPRCDTAAASCVECLAHADCESGGQPLCGPDHVCVRCLVDADCDGQVCERFDCKGG